MQEVDETTGLRARKKRARLEALVDATHRLAGEHGLEQVTVEAICAEVGVSVRTFFNYFETKDDAVLGMSQWQMDATAADLFAAGGPTGDLMADLQVLVASILDNPPLGPERIARALEIAKSHPELLVRAYVQLESHHDLIADLVRRRLGPDADDALVQAVGAVMMILAHSTFVRWHSAGSRGDVREHLPLLVADLGALFRVATPARPDAPDPAPARTGAPASGPARAPAPAEPATAR